METPIKATGHLQVCCRSSMCSCTAGVQPLCMRLCWCGSRMRTTYTWTPFYCWRYSSSVLLVVRLYKS